MILGTFVKKPRFFFNAILLSYQFPLVRPSCELGLPKCLPNASQMSPKCLPNVSQMPPRCFPDASKMPLRWLSDAFQIPDASQMPPKSCYIAFSSMILLHRSHSSMMTKDSSDMNDVFSSMILLHWPLFHDSSSWFRKTFLGSRAGVYFNLFERFRPVSYPERRVWCGNGFFDTNLTRRIDPHGPEGLTI